MTVILLQQILGVIHRIRDISLVQTAECPFLRVYLNKGTKKYFRQYMDVSFIPEKSKNAYTSLCRTRLQVRMMFSKKVEQYN